MHKLYSNQDAETTLSEHIPQLPKDHSQRQLIKEVREQALQELSVQELECNVKRVSWILAADTGPDLLQ